jgi:hypothetical protein
MLRNSQFDGILGLNLKFYHEPLQSLLRNLKLNQIAAPTFSIHAPNAPVSLGFIEFGVQPPSYLRITGGSQWRVKNVGLSIGTHELWEGNSGGYVYFDSGTNPLMVMCRSDIKKFVRILAFSGDCREVPALPTLQFRFGGKSGAFTVNPRDFTWKSSGKRKIDKIIRKQIGWSDRLPNDWCSLAVLPSKKVKCGNVILGRQFLRLFQVTFDAKTRGLSVSHVK